MSDEIMDENKTIDVETPIEEITLPEEIAPLETRLNDIETRISTLEADIINMNEVNKAIWSQAKERIELAAHRAGEVLRRIDTAGI